MLSHRFIFAALLLTATTARADKLNVVVTSAAYRSIAETIGGEYVEVHHIIHGYQDPHIVRPKPSLAVLLREADLFVATGMDLEMWAPALVDMSNNPNIRSGQKGYVSASAGVAIVEKPITVSRAEGDVHIYGNPHVTTSPLNGKVVAANIATGLKKIDPEHAETYDTNLKAFTEEIDRRTFGPKLVKMLGSKVLTKLAQRGKLFDFLEKKEFKGEKLINHLGGWMKKGMPLRGQKVVAYHKNWSYFTDLFDMEIVDYMEPKPGIPPTPGHVASVINKMKTQNIQVLLAANYFDVGKVRKVADRVGAAAVIVPLAPEPGTDVPTFLDQFDYWIDALTTAFARGA